MYGKDMMEECCQEGSQTKCSWYNIGISHSEDHINISILAPGDARNLLKQELECQISREFEITNTKTRYADYVEKKMRM